MSEDESWETLWNARLAAAESVLGPPAATVLHSPIPFSFGIDVGAGPDIVMFPNFLEGMLYMTADLIGSDEQPPNAAGQYELAIGHSGDEKWGVQIISRLAHYTLESVIDDGETMDIGSAVPEGSAITAILFRRIASFQVLGEPANIICCVGITAPELDLAKTAGSAMLIDKLGQDFLTTDLYRPSRV